MPKRTRKSAAGSPRAVLVLAITTLVLFAGGEAWLYARSDAGRLFAARTLGWGDRAQVTRLVGAQIHRGLDAAEVPRDSVREGTPSLGGARVRWRVGLAPEASLLEINYAITKCLRDGGSEVFSGREQAGKNGETLVTLEAGIGRRTTHEITLVRPGARPAGENIPKARLALVLYGFGDDPEGARAFFDLPLPFAVALTPGAPWSGALFRAAREKNREVVLHLPLEPINFPQVNPGPGAILVTMKPVKIMGMVRHYLDEAGPVSAVANHMGSLATQDMEVMRAVYQELKRRRLPFLHVAPAAGAVCKPLAADLGVEYDQPDVVIEGEARAKDTRALDKAWNQVLETTRRRGQATVMLRATPLTRDWLSKALARKRLGDIDVVPLESLLKRPAVL
jgi:hypothetical protein